MKASSRHQEKQQSNSSGSQSQQIQKDQSSFYQYSRYDNAVNVKQQLDHTLIGLLAFLILVSLVMVLIIFGLKYIIATTQLYGENENCLQSQIDYNGWDFSYRCLQCKKGFNTTIEGSSCTELL